MGLARSDVAGGAARLQRRRLCAVDRRASPGQRQCRRGRSARRARCRRCSTRSIPRPARSCGRAARRSPRSRAAGSRPPQARCISSRSTTRSTRLGYRWSTDSRPVGSLQSGVTVEVSVGSQSRQSQSWESHVWQSIGCLADYVRSVQRSSSAGTERAGFAQLPDGAGKDALVKVCGSCHQPERSASVRLTREGWEEVIADMIKRGAKGTDEEFGAVLEYLATNFLGEAPRPLNINRATNIELESVAGLTRKEAAAVLAYLDKVGRLQVARRAQEGSWTRLQENRSAQGLHRVLRAAASEGTEALGPTAAPSTGTRTPAASRSAP